MESLHESRLDDTDAFEGSRSTGRKKLMQTPYLVFPFFFELLERELIEREASDNPVIILRTGILIGQSEDERINVTPMVSGPSIAQ
jgi:hypothetical protein